MSTTWYAFLKLKKKIIALFLRLGMTCHGPQHGTPEQSCMDTTHVPCRAGLKQKKN